MIKPKVRKLKKFDFSITNLASAYQDLGMHLSETRYRAGVCDEKLDIIWNLADNVADVIASRITNEVV